MTDITIFEFLRRFPDDDACLEHLLKVRFGNRSQCPKCERETTWHKISKLTAYACQWCGHHVHPMAGTLFERSRTPLRKWFYALYLCTAAKRAVSARELQRQLGVTYKTAWRMGREIHKYIELNGNHTYLSPAIRAQHKPYPAYRGVQNIPEPLQLASAGGGS